jgi:hypothetical protein
VGSAVWLALVDALLLGGAELLLVVLPQPVKVRIAIRGMMTCLFSNIMKSFA